MELKYFNEFINEDFDDSLIQDFINEYLENDDEDTDYVY